MSESVAAKPQALSPGLVFLFASACGLAVANLYYAQPLLSTIAQAFTVTTARAGLVITVTQLGYAAGLLLIVPIGDLWENRRLINVTLCSTILALIGAATATSFNTFALSCLALGLTSVVTQVLLPFAASLAPAPQRGYVVGQVMSGLLTGILLARAVSGLVAGVLGWRAVYWMSAIVLTALNLVLYRILPKRQPDYTGSYGSLIRSLFSIFTSQPVLRRRAYYQWTMFASFSAFWSCSTFLLTAEPFHFTQTQIGLFSLAGAIGALTAPFAGRQGDLGLGRVWTARAIVLAGVSFALTALPVSGVAARTGLMVLGAIGLDIAVQTTLVLGQQAVYALNPEQRSRLNTLYIAFFFSGGAVGSAASSYIFTHWGWNGVVAMGCILAALAFCYWLTERPAPANSELLSDQK